MEGLAEQLAGVPFAAFYSSPIVRAQESAAILSARLGIASVTSAALGEYDVGELEGRSDSVSWRSYYAVQEAWIRERDIAARLPGGESLEDIRARFLPFIDKMLESLACGPILLLGHDGTFRCMLPLGRLCSGRLNK